MENHLPNMDNKKFLEQKTIVKLNTHITAFNKDRDFLSNYDLYVVCTCLLNVRSNKRKTEIVHLYFCLYTLLLLSW